MSVKLIEISKSGTSMNGRRRIAQIYVRMYAYDLCERECVYACFGVWLRHFSHHFRVFVFFFNVNKFCNSNILNTGIRTHTQLTFILHIQVVVGRHLYLSFIFYNIYSLCKVLANMTFDHHNKNLLWSLTYLCRFFC